MRSKWLLVKWKRNLRKIPVQVLAKLEGLSDTTVTATVVKKISFLDIAAGTYQHLGLCLDSNNKPLFPATLIPREDMGKYSHANINGKEVVRKDKPKIIKTFSWEARDWGRLGSHTCSYNREVYDRDFFGPKELEMRLELLGEESGPQPSFLFKFSVEQVLDPTVAGFKDDLLFNLNLLQENTGCADVFASVATREDYLKTVYVNWEFIPVGTADEQLNYLLGRTRARTLEEREKLITRYKVLCGLNPTEFIYGTSGFRRYFGAMFANDLVVFENLDYGNALYVLFGNWEALSRLSRLEIRNGNSADFVRIIHREGWEIRLAEVLAERRRKAS